MYILRERENYKGIHQSVGGGCFCFRGGSGNGARMKGRVADEG